MKRFRFSLERVRKLRKHQERAARLRMAEEMSVLNALELRCRQVEANLETCGAQGVGERMITLARALETGLASARERLLNEITVQEQRVVDATRVYHEQRRDIRTIEKIREQRLQVWREELVSEEQSEFDEIARVRFAERMRDKR